MRTKMLFQYWIWHPLSSFFLVIQLILILVLTAVASSATFTALKYYTPFSDYYRSQGMFLELSGVHFDNDSICEASSELEKKLKNAKVLSCYSLHASLKGKSTVTFRSYDPDVIQRYRPELIQGNWFSSDLSDDNVIHAVVSGISVNVGDTIEAVTPDKETIPIKVIGILDENTTLFGHTNGSRAYQSDYMQMYTDLSTETLTGTVILLNQAEILQAQKIYPSMSCPMSDVVLVKYDKNISEIDAAHNNVKLEKYCDILSAYYMTDLNDQFLRNIRPTLYFFLPMLIAAVVLMCVSAIYSNAIVTEEQMYSYAIFRLCGMNLRQCVCLNFSHVILDVCVAEVISIWIMKNLITGRSIMETTLYYNSSEMICCICVGIFYMLLSFIQPYITLHKQTIHNILIDHTGKEN